MFKLQKKKSHPLTKVFQSCRLCRTICKHAIKMEKNWKEHSFPGTSGGRISIPGYDKTKDYSFLNFEIKRSQYIRPKVTVHKGAPSILKHLLGLPVDGGAEDLNLVFGSNENFNFFFKINWPLVYWKIMKIIFSRGKKRSIQTFLQFLSCLFLLEFLDPDADDSEVETKKTKQRSFVKNCLTNCTLL